jgi:hypothetical protein
VPWLHPRNRTPLLPPPLRALRDRHLSRGMCHLPTLVVLVAAAAGCIVASACITWEPGGGNPCDNVAPNQQSVNALGAWACTIAQEGHLTNGATSSTLLTGEMCDRVCGPGFGNCQLPEQYIQAYLAAQAVPAPDAGSDAAADASSPSDAGDGAAATTYADAAPQPICPNMLQSQEFVVVCSNSC